MTDPTDTGHWRQLADRLIEENGWVIYVQVAWLIFLAGVIVGRHT